MHISAVYKAPSGGVIPVHNPRMRVKLAEYAETAGNGVEFELTVGSGKVTLLTHSQAIDLPPVDE